MLSTIELYVERLDNAFHGNPWFGNSVLKTIESTIDSDINFRLAEGNSIGQILEHMVNWRVFTVEKVKGNVNYDIELKSSADWNKGKEYTKEEFLNLIQKLKSTHSELTFLLHKHPDTEWLDKSVPGKEYSFNFLIDGIIQHDIYHSGQIAVLKNGTHL